MYKFRFQDLEIWKEAIDLSGPLFDIADDLHDKRRFSFADQLSRAVMSISNNIAEGSGSSFRKDFSNFLNFSKRSTFEVCNILIILRNRGFITEEVAEQYLKRLDTLSRKITNFRKTL